MNMQPVSHSDLRRMLSAPPITEQEISAAVDYCLDCTKGQEKQLAFVFEQYLHIRTHTLRSKITALEIMTRILLDNEGKAYARHFAIRIKTFLSKYSQSITDQGFQDQICTLYKKWKQSAVFADSFMETLKVAAGSALVKVDKKEQPSPFQRYSKAFLMAYRDVMMVETTKILYTAHCLKEKQVKKIHPFLESIRQLAESNEPIKRQPIEEMLAANKSNIHEMIIILNMQKEGALLAYELLKAYNPSEEKEETL